MSVRRIQRVQFPFEITKSIPKFIENVVFLFQLLPSTVVIWMLYSMVIAVVFAVVKLTNHRLHHMYDTSEVVKDEDEEDESTDGADKVEETSKTSETGTSKNPTQG